MGWSNCGTDSKGRSIGYGIRATCDHHDCKAKIDRGLSYACGGMHGTSDGCERYCCGNHLWHRYDPGDDTLKPFCFECTAAMDATRADEMTSALLAIMGGADPVETARAVLKTWDELWPDELAGAPLAEAIHV